MTTDSTPTTRVYSYDNADLLDGVPSPELVAESLGREGESGVCAAYLEDGTWRHLDASEVDHYRRNLGVEVVSVYVMVDEDESDDESAAPVVEVDLDSIEVHWPSDEDDREVRDAEALSHYIGVDVTIDGASVRVGCMVGAQEHEHDSIRAAGGGVRPHCTAWWADSSDWADVRDGARDAVLEALVESSWELYQRARGEA